MLKLTIMDYEKSQKYLHKLLENKETRENTTIQQDMNNNILYQYFVEISDDSGYYDYHFLNSFEDVKEYINNRNK